MNSVSENSQIPKIRKSKIKEKTSPFIFNNLQTKNIKKEKPPSSDELVACRPGVIKFIDYEPGQTYSSQLSIVNTGGCFASFRFGKFEESRYDLFNLEFKQTGRLAAGLSVPFKLKFFPNSRENFETFLTLHLKHRVIRIPIVCKYIMSDIEIKTREVDFKKTIQGEQNTQIVDIFNRGGKPTKVFIKDEAGQFLLKNVKFYRNIIDRMNASRSN